MRKIIVFWLSIALLVANTSHASQEVIVTDQAGRVVHIPQPVNRVVTTFIPATIFALSSGLADTLVGASNKDSTTAIYNALIDQDNPPVLVGNRAVGLSLETISSLKPDLVIMYGQKDGVRIANRLVELGIPAIVIMPESLAAMSKTLELIGKASGREEHTAQVVAAMKGVEEEVTKRVENNNAPRVYYAAGNMLRTVSGNMLQNDIIDVAGGKNVSEKTRGFFVNISREQLIAWNPEVLLCSNRITDEVVKSLEAPEFSSVTAVAKKQVYKIPSKTYWDYPSPLAMAGLVWMSKHIHPNGYGENEMQKMIDGFYDTLFGAGFSKQNPVVVGKTIDE